MGMFDNLSIEADLEMPFCPVDPTTVTWQTKALECLLEKYRVAEDGTLEKQLVEYHEVPEAEREEDDLLGIDMPKTRPEPIGWDPYPYHGDMRIVGGYEQPNGDRTTLEYWLRFDRGEVTDVFEDKPV